MENYWGQWEEGRRTARDQQERGERIREGKWEVKMINVQWNVFMKLMPSGKPLFYTLKINKKKWSNNPSYRSNQSLYTWESGFDAHSHSGRCPLHLYQVRDSWLCPCHVHSKSLTYTDQVSPQALPRGCVTMLDCLPTFSTLAQLATECLPMSCAAGDMSPSWRACCLCYHR